MKEGNSGVREKLFAVLIETSGIIITFGWLGPRSSKDELVMGLRRCYWHIDVIIIGASAWICRSTDAVAPSHSGPATMVSADCDKGSWTD